MKEKNFTKISLSTFFLILAIIAIIVMGIFIYKLNNDKTAEIQKSTELQTQVNSLNGKDNSDDVTNSKKSNTEVNKNTSEEALYVYSSGDNAATNGNPELLYVYEFSNNKMKFKYHTPWNNEDIEGIAKSTDGEKYIYENSNRKLEILLNSMGENSVKVTEYENNSMTSYKNLFK